jgi:hypothetical protein
MHNGTSNRSSNLYFGGLLKEESTSLCSLSLHLMTVRVRGGEICVLQRHRSTLLGRFVNEG